MSHADDDFFKPTDVPEPGAPVPLNRDDSGARSGVWPWHASQTYTGTVSAPGKAFLIGEYAVLYGHSAIVTAVDVRAHAHAARKQHGERPMPDSPFVAAAVEVVRKWLLDKGYDINLPGPEVLPVVTTVGFTAGNRKLGLGSSAAVTAAVVGWYFAAVGLDPELPSLRAAAETLARDAHAIAQHGRGSGADVSTACFGGTVRFSRPGGVEPVELPEWLAVGFFDAGAPASTGSFVAAVEAGAARDPSTHAAAIDAIAGASERFQAAIAPGFAGGKDAVFAEIAAACKQHNAGLRKLEVLGDITILPPRIQTIIETAEWAGLAAKPSGAGGGDLVAVFAKDAAALDHLGVELYYEHQIAFIRKLSIRAPGLRSEARPPVNSRIRGLFKRSIAERRVAISVASGLDHARFSAAEATALGSERADHMIENVIGALTLPLGVATNFCINGRDYLIPMCVEEASVVAAASNAAKMIRSGGGFAGFSDPPWMIAQIQLVRDAACDQGKSQAEVIAAIEGAKAELLAMGDEAHPRLVARGGGSRDVEVRRLDEDTLVVHVLVDCRDAMGANLINTVAEVVSPRLAALSGWRPVLRILSNLADRRASHISAHVPVEALATGKLDGPTVASRIEEASRFAELDPYRATTHNKGIMNGVDAVVLATGNDWRAMEASAHAYAVKDGRYGPLAIWRTEADASGAIVSLRGELSLPTAVGVVGGATRSHPTARLAIELLGHPSGTELGLIMGAAGLASNLAALRALATEGIQRGHMSLHARAVAVAAGARGAEVESIAQRLIDVGEIKPERAKALLDEHRAPKR
ncbi:hydroxymethylglutaryl-CoA reductase [Plesiocystis pacifica SIR-1]|uniref:3-hydroxy-3-methylglutaryl coenzyme A reductase n=1 Tax=Plesiocystis pacifica SIR-1 TaxID=391625 RepID=A6G140_9BACT|nr:hydroxymethylglutaryl-CoA reductase, degradative [Plesiocystis pacifica]EDM80335.1 hydroxymethylglutaryl-CoA reductase [Plesiocystis pacifica SIR-1]